MYYIETNTYKAISYLLKLTEVTSTFDSSYVAAIALYQDFAERYTGVHNQFVSFQLTGLIGKICFSLGQINSYVDRSLMSSCIT